MLKILKNKNFILLIVIFFTLASCAKEGFFKTGDARKNPPDPRERVKKNLEEGKGFRMNDAIGGSRGGTNFEFASSNELWRASLDVLDFMPLTSANYSGGIIITDWYSDSNNPSESIKISIRFLTNEIRSDALDIKVFNRKCLESIINCKITETNKVLANEINKEILKKAAIYEKENLLKKGKKRKRPK